MAHPIRRSYNLTICILQVLILEIKRSHRLGTFIDLLPAGVRHALRFLSKIVALLHPSSQFQFCTNHGAFQPVVCQ